MIETAIQSDAMTSPSTICKYCGEDFKFFRALKHHLRSHSSCRKKPYMCKLCSNGFSTKPNCVRHIEKQHPELEQSKIEEFIVANDLSESEASSSPINYQAAAAMMSLPSSSHLPPHHLRQSPSMTLGSLSAQHQQHQLPKTSPQPAHMPMTLARLRDPPMIRPINVSPYPQQPMAHMPFRRQSTKPFIPIIKTEIGVPGYDEPLDFSIKPVPKLEHKRVIEVSPIPVRPQKPADSSSISQPMDLTVRTKPAMPIQVVPVSISIIINRKFIPG